MDFMLFQLVFAIILIALAIIIWLFIRAWRRRSAERGPTLERMTPAPEAIATGFEAAPRRGLGRKFSSNVTAEEEPARVRRRQIGPGSAVEALPEDYAADAAPDDDPADFLPEAVAEETTVETGLETGMETGAAPIEDSEPAAETFAGPAEGPPPGPIQTETMERLEDAFVRLQGGDMTLADYIALTEEQDQLLAERIAALESDPAGHAAMLDDARAAQDAVSWCRQWAGDMAAENRPGDAI